MKNKKKKTIKVRDLKPPKDPKGGLIGLLGPESSRKSGELK
jgi:hypothetical protein